MGYIELHCHSAYSFLDGASQPEELVIKAAELGYEAFLEAWSGVKNVQGVLFYEWHESGGERDGGYTPKGKPALKPLQKWMKGE